MGSTLLCEVDDTSHQHIGGLLPAQTSVISAWSQRCHAHSSAQRISRAPGGSACRRRRCSRRAAVASGRIAALDYCRVCALRMSGDAVGKSDLGGRLRKAHCALNKRAFAVLVSVGWHDIPPAGCPCTSVWPSLRPSRRKLTAEAARSSTWQAPASLGGPESLEAVAG
jgi:hypothetical protein